MTIETILTTAYTRLQKLFWDKSTPFGDEQRAAAHKLSLLAHELTARNI